jgi:predicted secreted protein
VPDESGRGYDRRPKPIEAGADLTIVLCSNPTTGFSWGEPQILDPSVFRLADRTYRAPGVTSSSVVGAAGAEILTIHAVASGTTTLSISYGQPWRGGVQGEWVYRLTVTVG